MNWFKKLFRKPDILARYKRIPVKLTLEQWQRNDQLVTEMLKISNLPVWRAMLDVMRNECPAFNVGFDPKGTLMTDRASLQSQTEGYMMAINNLEAMSNLQFEEKQIESTFTPEEG